MDATTCRSNKGLVPACRGFAILTCGRGRPSLEYFAGRVRATPHRHVRDNFGGDIASRTGGLRRRKEKERGDCTVFSRAIFDVVVASAFAIPLNVYVMIVMDDVQLRHKMGHVPESVSRDSFTHN